MKKIVVFLASSDELYPDRREVGDFFQALNNIYVDRGIFLQLVTWEYGSQAMANGRKQDEYNQIIRDSALCFFLFFTKAGEYTLEEFDTALAAFKTAGKPQIVVYAKELPAGDTVADELAAFLQRLDKEMKHFWNKYGNIDTLKLGLLMQIRRSGVDIPIGIEDDRAVVGGQALIAPRIDLRNVPSYRGYERIHAAQQELNAIQGEYETLRARHDADKGDNDLRRQFEAIASRHQALSKELDEARKLFLELTQSVVERTSSGELLLPRQIQAYRLFEAGQVDEALEILSQEKLREEAAQAQARHDAAKQAARVAEQDEMQAYVNANLDRYDFLRSKPVTAETLAEMEEALREAYQIEIHNDLLPRAMFQLGSFLDAQNRFPEAIDLYEAFWNDAHFVSDQELRAVALNNLGSLYLASKRFEQGEGVLVESVELCRKLADDNPQTYNFILASSLNNLGNLYLSTKRFGQAEGVLLEALELRRSLTDDDPQVYNLDRTLVLNNLGILYQDTGCFSQAEEVLVEAVELRRSLADDNPQAYNPGLATTLNNLGNLYRISGCFGQAEEVLLEAVELYRGLAGNNPQAYNPGLVSALNNLSIPYLATRRFGQAEMVLVEAVELYRGLVGDNPQAYNSGLATTLSNLGDLYRMSRRFGQAEMVLVEAVELYRGLVGDNPQAYNPGLAMTLNNLGILYQDTGRFGQAEKILVEAVELYRSLAGDNPQTYNFDFATSLDNLGGLYLETERFKQAEGMLGQAVVILRQLTERAPTIYKDRVLNSLRGLTICETQLGHTDEATKLQEELERLQDSDA